MQMKETPHISKHHFKIESKGETIRERELGFDFK